jgi:serine/threonine protein kinase
MVTGLPLIAGTYQLIGKIGAGGGGVVYLAEHNRLNKKVILKADKSTLTAKPDVLRREADALKNLSHTYIPQVYDFVESAGTVYTVMDYIEGESFDKPLGRGERFPQSKIIEWTEQLLDALVYLHGRPPNGILHADIKPANIILTPQNDIRLIDFNIALALGEDGAVAVGRSFGYASPEHYGFDYTSNNTTRKNTNTDSLLTELSDDTSSYTETVMEATSNIEDSSSSKKTITLDVRSDIYGLGATLYHMVTGKRPAQEAIDVTPINDANYSKGFIDIITKAMNPNPEMRWQSASEMLNALTHFKNYDPRKKRKKIIAACLSVFLSLLLFTGGFAAFVGLKQSEQHKNMLMLAEYSGNALRNGNVTAAINYALSALSEKPGIFTPPNTSQAQKALTNALGIYDLSDGYKPHLSVELPSGVIKLAISPNESLSAAMSLGMLTIFETATGDIIAKLPTVESALADMVFIGNDKIAYAGINGLTLYDISTRRILWTGEMATSIAVSKDGTTIACVYRDKSYVMVYNILGEVIHMPSFGDKRMRLPINDRLADPKNNIFELNEDGSMLAVSFSDGGLTVFEDNVIIVLLEQSDYTHFSGGFYGKFLVFSASNSNGSMFVAFDMEELVQTDGFTAPEQVGVTTDENGVYLTFMDRRTRYNPYTMEESAPDFGRNPPLYIFEYGIDSPNITVSKLESNADKDIFHYDALYYHIEARISEDRQTVMLFSIDGFRLYDISGELIADVIFDDNIFDQQYRRRDGQSYLEVTWYDGTVRRYSAVDGAMFSEEQTAPPDKGLYEEFIADYFKIASPLHGTPAAYNIRNGRLIRELEKDSFLTYVTQVGEYVITQYIRMSDGYHYGLLLNGNAETLAYLPYLCDIIGNDLIFNFGTGYLRTIHIHHLGELIEIAKHIK